MANPTDLIPVTRVEFAAEMAPCLELVAPTGMDEDRKRSWLNAAYKALDGIPIALLKRGAAAAMAKADHPAKIVPVIMREVQEDWDWRRRYVQPVVRHTAPEPRRFSRSDAREIGPLMANLARDLRRSAEESAA